MRSIGELERCAAQHLADYTAVSSLRAFRAYDLLGDPRTLTPTDLLAPALLDAPVKPALVRRMVSGSADDPYASLHEALQAVIRETDGSERFEEQNLDDEQGAWGLVRGALRASNSTRGIKASKVTKVLHRKRPFLVPIFDRVVAKFYGTTPRTPERFWPALQDDLRENHALVEKMADGLATPDGRPLSPLRALDIVVWEHTETGCHH